MEESNSSIDSDGVSPIVGIILMMTGLFFMGHLLLFELATVWLYMILGGSVVALISFSVIIMSTTEETTDTVGA